MKTPLALLCFVLSLAATARVRADVCRPPVAGTWSADRSLVGLYNTGQANLAAARKLEGDEKRAMAALAEIMFRELDERVPCSPPAVIGLAQALELRGEYLEATEQYRRLLDAKPEIQKLGYYDDSLAEAERAWPLALDHTALLTLHLRGRDCAVGVPRAFLNDAPTPLDTGVRVELGEHSARVEALGCTAFSRTLTVSSAGELPVNIDLSPKGPPPPHFPRWVLISGAAVLAVGAGVAIAVAVGKSPSATASYTCSSQAGLGC